MIDTTVIETVDAFTESQINYLAFHGFSPKITTELKLMVYVKTLASNKLEFFYTYEYKQLCLNAWLYESNALVYRDRKPITAFSYFSDFRRYINEYLGRLSTSH